MPEFNDTRTALDLEEQRLKIQELKLKVKDLGRPDYLRPSFWTSIFAIVVAVGSVAGQSAITVIRNREGKEIRDQFLVEKTVAENTAKKARQAANDAERKKQIANQEYDVLEQQKSTTQNTLLQLQTELAKYSRSKNNDETKRGQINQIQPSAKRIEVFTSQSIHTNCK